MSNQQIELHAAKKAYKGVGMEGMIATWYARNTARSMKDFASDACRVAALVASSADVLEVAPGPGYFAVELAKLGDYRITGLDISKSFVKIARDNAARAGVRVRFEVGSASAMPFEDDSFDFLFCRAAFKNFSEPVRALREMYRVLRPGGRVWIVDLRRDASLSDISKAVGEMGLGAVNVWFTRMAFRFSLIKRAWTKAEFEQFLAQTQFPSVEIEQSAMGLDIWLGK